MAEEKYPKEFKEGDADNSAGFVTPYKIATGANMGDLRISGKITVMDENGVVRLLMGFQADGF